MAPIDISGVLRGSGQQLIGSIINGTAFYVLALPGAVLLGFWPVHRGVQVLVLIVCCEHRSMFYTRTVASRN